MLHKMTLHTIHHFFGQSVKCSSKTKKLDVRMAKTHSDTINAPDIV